MDFEFINNVRIELESTNIFKYTVVGGKTAAILLLLFSIIERWSKSLTNQRNVINDVITISGYVLLILSTDFIVDVIENVFQSIDIEISKTKDTLYTDVFHQISDDYRRIIKDGDAWYIKIANFYSNFIFMIGYVLVAIMSCLLRIADMSMVCGYLLVRIFFIEMLKFLFPIVVALSTIRQTRGLIGKWFRLYIGISILGIIYIGIIQICKITQQQLHNSFVLDSNNNELGGMFNMEASVWGSIVSMIVVFSLKASLFNKATSQIINFFS